MFGFCRYNIWERAAQAKLIRKAFTDSQKRVHGRRLCMCMCAYMSDTFCFSYLEYFGTVVKFQVPNSNSLNSTTRSQNVSKDRFHNSLAFLVIVCLSVSAHLPYHRRRSEAARRRWQAPAQNRYAPQFCSSPASLWNTNSMHIQECCKKVVVPSDFASISCTFLRFAEIKLEQPKLCSRRVAESSKEQARL